MFLLLYPLHFYFSVSSRPSRKTKEAATLYMEMLTKDLRSPDEEFDGDYINNLSEPSSSTRKGLLKLNKLII